MREYPHVVSTAFHCSSQTSAKILYVIIGKENSDAVHLPPARLRQVHAMHVKTLLYSVRRRSPGQTTFLPKQHCLLYKSHDFPDCREAPGFLQTLISPSLSSEQLKPLTSKGTLRNFWLEQCPKSHIPLSKVLRHLNIDSCSITTSPS